jgi:hypothetical protein
MVRVWKTPVGICQLHDIGEPDGASSRTPWNPQENLACEQGREVLGKEGDEQEGDHEKLGADHGALVADCIGDPAVEIQADNLAAYTANLDVSLPVSRDDLAAPPIGLVAVLLLKADGC